MLTSNDIRQKYLDFFKQQGHAIIPSAPIVPDNDPTTLFTGSGMQPMVPYLLGQPHPLGKRITDSQKSFRAQDIEEIGDTRHTTFFEMLGNWSLGDYFKAEQIPWIFTFLTKEIGLDPERLYVTCFRGNTAIGIPQDEESALIWKKLFRELNIDAQVVDFPERDGMQGGRIFYYDETKNWWSRSGVPANMPVGEPGGPDSEMFWDFGVSLQLHEQSQWKDQPCHVNCDCGRFFEIGNSVFMQYVKTETGFEQLKQRNVDFGGGLERMAAALHNNPDVFLIDLFHKQLAALEELSQQKYGSTPNITMAFRVIMDHVRASTFILADGIVPSNLDQGYVLRRLLRRALRYARKLNIKEHSLSQLAEQVIIEYAAAYPKLNEQRDSIISEITTEEDKFAKALVNGEKQFEKLTAHISVGGIMPGEHAFHLFDTYGFPLEITKELAQEKSIVVDEAGFIDFYKQHQEQSRAGAQKRFKGGLADASWETIRGHTATHLLHESLRRVLGSHVFQKGSNITPDRVRFDFSHQVKLTAEEIEAVETMVNEQVQRALPVHYKIMTVPEARALGAIGLFDDKYAEKVKVYIMGDFSKEFCGGPHVNNTSEVGHFKIVKEEACSAGVRRIKAVLSTT